MSLAVLKSRALTGMDAPEVTVEVHLANGLPAFAIVGLPDTEVKEAKDRVRASLQTANFEFPARRITVNLAPADLPKESGRFDLAIALGILAASGQIPERELHRYEFAGELSLSGELRPVRGALAMAFAMQRAAGPSGQARAFVVPRANAAEAALVREAVVLPADSLLQVCAHFTAGPEKPGASPPGPDTGQTPPGSPRLARYEGAIAPARPVYPDFIDVKGQLQARRALEVAAAGNHSALMIGPPGTGKSMLASRFPGILPPMSDEEALESAAVQSVTGGFDSRRWKTRPYRAPHHTASGVALVGGGGVPRPGEISLAHRGVLFLDELPEFDRRVLEVLREPLETGHITISRAARQADFPARFQLIAAMNPCPCGYLGHASGRCHCTVEVVARYQSRISGPLLDRIDMQIEVAALSHAELVDGAAGEASADIAARVARAAQIQLERQGKMNQALSTGDIETWCRPDAAGEQLLRAVMARLHWSARAYHRVLKVARTIADLDGAPSVTKAHVAQAIQYRRALGE
jgi:magnesium chelatase family protein